MQLSINMFDILSAKDPDINFFIPNSIEDINPKNIFLQTEHILMKSHWPIFQFYESLYNTEKTPLYNRPENILLIKSSARELQAILVPENYIQIIESLNKRFRQQDLKS